MHLKHSLSVCLPLHLSLSVCICGSLNVIDCHNLIGAGVGMALLAEAGRCGAAFEVSYAQVTTQCNSQLPIAGKM